MADVAKAWKFVLSNEDTVPPSGKIVSEPNGAQARLGINSHAWPEALSDGFYSMDLPAALQYAEDHFKYHYWSMICGQNVISELIASKWADLAFNCGVEESVLLVQRAANAIWSAQPIKVDGHCGAWTLARLNMIIAEREEDLYAAIIAQGETFYEALRARKPAEFSEQLEEEWLRRLRIRPPD